MPLFFPPPPETPSAIVRPYTSFDQTSVPTSRYGDPPWPESSPSVVRWPSESAGTPTSFDALPGAGSCSPPTETDRRDGGGLDDATKRAMLLAEKYSKSSRYAAARLENEARLRIIESRLASDIEPVGQAETEVLEKAKQSLASSQDLRRKLAEKYGISS